MQTWWRCLSSVTRQPAVLSYEAAASSVMHHFICVLLFPLTLFLSPSLLPSWDKTSKALKLCVGVGFPENLGFDIHESTTSPKLKKMSQSIRGLWNNFQYIAISIWKHNEIEKQNYECASYSEFKYHFLKPLFQLCMCENVSTYVLSCDVKCVFIVCHSQRVEATALG